MAACATSATLVQFAALRKFRPICGEPLPRLLINRVGCFLRFEAACLSFTAVLLCWSFRHHERYSKTSPDWLLDTASTARVHVPSKLKFALGDEPVLL